MAPPPPEQRGFLFVPVKGPRGARNVTARRDARAYVAREYSKKRREQGIKSLQTRSRAGWTLKDDALSARSHGALAEKRLGEESGSHGGSSSSSEAGRSRAVSPGVFSSALSIRRKDPFDSFPLRMGNEDLELVDFCTFPASDLCSLRRTYLPRVVFRDDRPDTISILLPRRIICADA